MRRARGYVAAHFLAAALLPAVVAGGAGSASAIEFGCNIGKPSYCFKYGQMFCGRENILPDREQACADWVAACLECHARVPQCLGGTRPPRSSPLCKACDEEWRACMHAIDEAYWPNRRRKADADDGAAPRSDKPAR